MPGTGEAAEQQMRAGSDTGKASGQHRRRAS